MLAAAALSQPTVDVVTGAGEEGSFAAFQEAVEAGVIEIVGERIRFTHPLLASVLHADAPEAERRDVHRRLAGVAQDLEERARLLALAATGPDPSIAAQLDEAAQGAAARGAPDAAAILSEEARRLTPEDRDEDARRRDLEAADYHFRAGDTSRARELLEKVLDRSPPGPPRAWVLYRLGTVRLQEESWPQAEELLSAALEEAGDDAPLRLQLHVQLVLARGVAGDLVGAVTHARQATSLRHRVQDPALQAYALAAVATGEFLLGHGVQMDSLRLAEDLARAAGPQSIRPFPLLQPAVSQGMVLKWSDDLDAARAKLGECYRHAVEMGDESSVPFILYHLSELECWAGNWEIATGHADEGNKIALQSGQEGARGAILYVRALALAHQGLIDPARADAEEALGLCRRSGNLAVMQLALSALGFIELSLGDSAGVHEHLGPMADMLAAMGLGEPGVVKFLPDEIECLISLGELDKARALVDQLEERGRALDRVWALATGARCRAILDAAAGWSERADEALGRALAHHRRLPMPFELGRTLLAAGAIHRRSKRKRAAKESLQQAVEVFERLGAPLWADKARQELRRVGLRPTAPLGLTPSEQRVAELVAAGSTNKETADALFISPKTVDSTLSRIYRKLGVRSRTELAAKLAEMGHSTPS
jgi:DNA-binding CsgD family transcriptional regulator